VTGAIKRDQTSDSVVADIWTKTTEHRTAWNKCQSNHDL